MAIPAGWAENKDSGKPGIYSATITNYKISERDLINRKIIVEVNGFTGDFNVYSETPIIGSTSFGRTPIYTRSSSGAIDIQNQTIYNNLNQQGKIQQIETTIKPKIIEINKTVATTEEKQALANSAFYKSSSNAAPSGKPKEPPQPPPGAPTQDPSKKGDEGFTPDKDANSLFENPNIPYADGASPRKNIGILKYHGSIDTNGQDYIKFDILEYGTRKLDQGSLQLSQRNFGEAPIGTIILPIQPSISDFNSVTWDEVPMDIVDMTGQLIGLKLMTEGAKEATEIANTVKSKIQDKAISDAIGSAMATFVAQKAVQSNNNLLTRITGAVLNPNMELLFQGPTLRPFQFAFRMTPRDDKEAKQVKSIIRAFKEFSAVQRGIENLFLKTPHVFRIRYMLGTKSNTDHPSINRIKICALQSIQVDYTPDQTYMTYNDDNATMTSYGMSLTFKELEPIYSDDYKTFNTDEIGY